LECSRTTKDQNDEADMGNLSRRGEEVIPIAGNEDLAALGRTGTSRSFGLRLPRHQEVDFTPMIFLIGQTRVNLSPATAALDVLTPAEPRPPFSRI
jgi:hypothetical protein